MRPHRSIPCHAAVADPAPAPDPGNLNALKHGQNSAQFQALVAHFASHPASREALIRFTRRRRAQMRLAERTAQLVLKELFINALMSLKNNQTEKEAADTDRLLDLVLFSRRSNTEPESPDQSNARDPDP